MNNTIISMSKAFDDIADCLGIDDKARGCPDNIIAEIELLKHAKNDAYSERNHVVAALSKLFPSYKTRTNIDGWDERWHGCVYIDLPTGQISYHYHDDESYLFENLPSFIGVWDGHTKDMVHQRLNALRYRKEDE